MGTKRTINMEKVERIFADVMTDVMARDIPEEEKPGQILFEFEGRGFYIEADERWDYLASDAVTVEDDDDDEECAPDCEERDQCKQAGQVGHWQCGHCDEHNRPRHHCGSVCMVTP